MKFNFSVKAKAATVNYEGAKAYSLTPEMEMYSAVATTMLSDTFYEKADERMERMIALMSKLSPLFIAKLAVYARNEMNLRSVPVLLAAELAKIHQGDNLVSKTIERIVKRPDEITELLAYYQLTNKRTAVKKLNKVSKQVQKGLAASFNNFDEYQFAKYDRDTEVKLRDALFLVHPKAKDENQQVIFNKIVNKELSVPYTWETELSALGQVKFETAEVKKNAVKTKWEELIDSQKIGYMALLRNLRNILDANVDTAYIRKIGDYLANEKAVANSKQLPFRFLAAYREIKGVNSGYTSYILDALEKAIQLSVRNMQGFNLDTRVVVACDVSGSMQKPISAKSKVLLYDIGLLLGMLLRSKSENVVTGMFGDKWKQVPLATKNVLASVDEFYKREGEVGYATNGYLVLEDLISRKYASDKVMFFTDTQMWDSNTRNAFAKNTMRDKWLAYKKIAPGAKLYLFDLAGYGKMPIRTEDNDVYIIAGWSDKIFDVLNAMEDGSNALKMIEQIEL
ncbi:TROVE domain-containing protein [Chitinophagaceae bacterium LWZ2-11]